MEESFGGRQPERANRLVDLKEINDSALSADVRLGAHLKVMKYVQRQDLPDQLDGIVAPELPDADMLRILYYIDRGPVAVSRERLRKVLARRLGDARGERIMGHFSQEYFADGRTQGRAEGRAEGELAGKAQALMRLLEKRFGVVPPQLRERILAADSASIEAWFDRALEEHDMQSVFPSTELG